jgi:hypothetical protein
MAAGESSRMQYRDEYGVDRTGKPRVSPEPKVGGLARFRPMVSSMHDGKPTSNQHAAALATTKRS